MDQAEAIAELRKCSGTQFDTHIVNVFVDQVLPKTTLEVPRIAQE
jgi:HD-GYP domain-containing protein (c-di-GMP phosphodiesterase class II)